MACKGVYLLEAQKAVPPHTVYVCTVYLFTQGRGGEFISNKQLPKDPFTGHFFRWRHFALVFILCS
jgi:hypothetical protein